MDAMFEGIRQAIRQMIEVSDQELDELLSKCFIKTFRRQELLSQPNVVPNDVFFINHGLVRMLLTGDDGVEHTLHFALANQFISNYSAFIRKQPAMYGLRAEEDSEVVVLPRQAIDWGYSHLKQGDRLGRRIAEFYFIYQDQRINNQYVLSPKQRYDEITQVFPNIHNRVPQHMIASYLGVTAVHLSRLKKAASGKS